MKICLIGPPGAGKGTQAANLVAHYGGTHISTGDVLRSVAAQPTHEGIELNNLLKNGHLAPSPMVVRLLGEYLSGSKYAQGYILDGSPRTAPEFLQWIQDFPALKPQLVIRMNVPDAIVIERLTQRRICVVENKIFSGIYDQCPTCRGPLMMREDDYPDAIRMRLQHYHAQQPEIETQCRKLDIWHEVDGSKNSIMIKHEIIRIIDGAI